MQQNVAELTYPDWCVSLSTFASNFGTSWWIGTLRLLLFCRVLLPMLMIYGGDAFFAASSGCTIGWGAQSAGHDEFCRSCTDIVPLLPPFVNASFPFVRHLVYYDGLWFSRSSLFRLALFLPSVGPLTWRREAPPICPHLRFRQHAYSLVFSILVLLYCHEKSCVLWKEEKTVVLELK